MATLATVNEDRARSEHDGARLDRADHQPRTCAEQNLYISRLGQAEGALRLFDSATARGLLDLCRPGPGEPDRRGWEWSYLDQWCNPELRALALPTTLDSHSVAVSPDGRLLAVGCAPTNGLTSGTPFPPVPAYLIQPA